MSSKYRMPVSPYGRPDDQFGYAVYSVVVMATPEQREKVQAIRDAVHNQRSMIPAHVTVKGTFCEIPNLDRVKALVGQAARDSEHACVRFAQRPVVSRNRLGEVSASIGIEVTPELVSLHRRLFEALSPITTSAYFDDSQYHPHLTVYDEPLPERGGSGKLNRVMSGIAA